MKRHGQSCSPFSTLLEWKHLVFSSSNLSLLESFPVPTTHSSLYIPPSSSQTSICSKIVFPITVPWDLKVGTGLPSLQQSYAGKALETPRNGLYSQDVNLQLDCWINSELKAEVHPLDTCSWSLASSPAVFDKFPNSISPRFLLQF